MVAEWSQKILKKFGGDGICGKLEFNGSNTGSSDDPINDPIKLNKNEQAVVDIIMINPNTTRKEMAEKLECSESTVKRAIDGLVKKGILVREGSRKSGNWIVHI